MQIVLAGLGLAAALSASEYGFPIVKWLGVSYLVWLGARQIIRFFKAHGIAAPARRASLKTFWARGFITSAANPKAVVFFATLFPQFRSTTHSLLLQVLVLGFTYLVIDGIFLCAYGKEGNGLATNQMTEHRYGLRDCQAQASLVHRSYLGLNLKPNRF